MIPQKKLRQSQRIYKSENTLAKDGTILFQISLGHSTLPKQISGSVSVHFENRSAINPFPGALFRMLTFQCQKIFDYPQVFYMLIAYKGFPNAQIANPRLAPHRKRIC